MSKQSEQENLNKLTQRVNLTSANHRLRSQSPAPYSVMGASSLAPGECSTDNWGFFYSPGYIRQLTLSKLFDEDDDEELFPQGFVSMTQTRETNPNWETYSTPRPSLEEGEGIHNSNVLPQRFNSHHNSEGDVEDGAQSFEPDPTHRDLAEEASDEPRVTPSHLDKAGTPSQASTGKKRQKIIPSKEDELERVQKKRDADKKYRADIRREVTEHRRMKPEYDRVMEVASRFGGIDEMESQMNHMNSELRRIQQKEVDYDKFPQLFETELNRLGQMKSKYGEIDQMEFMLDKFKQLEAQSNRLESMKSKYGGIEKMESMLDRFMGMEAESRKLNEIKSKLGIQEIGSILQKWKEMEDELRRFNQIKSSFGGIDEIEPEINRLKKMELQFEKHKHTVNQNQLPQERSTSQLLDLNGDSGNVSYQCGINLNSLTTESGATPDLQYSDVLVDQLIARVTDENVASNLDTNSFKDLLNGAWENVSNYKIPSALVPTARSIFDVYGDIKKNCKLSGITVHTIFVLLCAAIKEMGDLTLDQVTEEIIWRLRDPIMDAKRSDFDVGFAMKYLKLLVQGYFGIQARKDHNSLEKIITCLKADEAALRRELDKKSQEIKTMEAKQRNLTSDKCRICLDSANKILCKTVSIF